MAANSLLSAGCGGKMSERKGGEPSCDTERTNSIFGDLENIRFTRRGHMKADLYDDGAMLAEITIHKRFVAYTENNPGQNA